MSNIQKSFDAIIKAKIDKYLNVKIPVDKGKVISVSDGIAIVSGLGNVKNNEVVKFENNTMGIAIELSYDFIGVALLGKYDDISEGSQVVRTNDVISIPVGDEMLGRVVNPLGEALDGGKAVSKKKLMPIERNAPGVIQRSGINEPLETGIILIDSIFPIGKGQRELIIGDRQTGKSSIALDTIVNQKGKNVKCVYVGIGLKNSTTSQLINFLSKNEALQYTTIMATNASDNPALLYIAPYSGMRIAEEWMEKGENVLIVFDDLTKHANAYRAISLLLRRPPGREAYPGDIFYLHSRLLERAGKLNSELKGGSITALPIIETQMNDISTYIPTNLISITDGQLFTNSDLFNEGQKPAIDPTLSVSRVGGDAQIKIIKKLSSNLKIKISQYLELKEFSQFGGEIDETTKNTIENGKKILQLMIQNKNTPYSIKDLFCLLIAIKYNYLFAIDVKKIDEYKVGLLNYLKKNEVYKNLKIEEGEVGMVSELISTFNKENSKFHSTT